MLVWLGAVNTVSAQHCDSLSTEQLRSKTMSLELLFKLPPIYTVLKCDVYITKKDRTIISVFYARDSSRYCINANSSDFSVLWSKQISTFSRSGDTISIDNIIIQRGERTMKLAPRCFVIP